MARVYYTEAKWFNEGYVPSLNEYLSNALISTDYYAITVVSFVGMGEIADKKAFEWLQTRPKNVVSSEIISRLMDDVVSHKVRHPIHNALKPRRQQLFSAQLCLAISSVPM